MYEKERTEKEQMANAFQQYLLAYQNNNLNLSTGESVSLSKIANHFIVLKIFIYINWDFLSSQAPLLSFKRNASSSKYELEFIWLKRPANKREDEEESSFLDYE